MRGVTRKGSEESPTVILLHGGVINRHMWGPVIENLADEYDCIAIDLPGHGQLMDQDFSVERSVEAVIDILDHFEIETAALVGLSLGGYIAQATAGAHPDRVDGLVLSGATINYTGWDGITTWFFGALFPLLSRPAMKAFAKQMTKDLGQELAGAVLAGGLSGKGGGQGLRRLPGVDYAEGMLGFSGPIVVANGERDTQNRDGEERFLELFPHTNSVIIEDAGHACALQQPESFSGAIRQLMAMSA